MSTVSYCDPDPGCDHSFFDAPEVPRWLQKSDYFLGEAPKDVAS
jgi:hypothetical protein